MNQLVSIVQNFLIAQIGNTSSFVDATKAIIIDRFKALAGYEGGKIVSDFVANVRFAFALTQQEIYVTPVNGFPKNESFTITGLSLQSTGLTPVAVGVLPENSLFSNANENEDLSQCILEIINDGTTVMKDFSLTNLFSKNGEYLNVYSLSCKIDVRPETALKAIIRTRTGAVLPTGNVFAQLNFHGVKAI